MGDGVDGGTDRGGVAAALRRFCRDRGMTTAALAAHLGVTRGFLSQLCNGRRALSPGLLDRLPRDVALYVLPARISELQARLDALRRADVPPAPAAAQSPGRSGECRADPADFP